MVSFDPPATRDWDFPRSVASIAVLVAVGGAVGVAPARMLRGSGLAVGDLTDHQREVTADQELCVVRNLQSAAPDVTGPEVGTRYHASTFGALGFALLSSATLGDAANLALRFIDLSFTFTIPSARLDADTVEITVLEPDLPGDVRRFLVERDLAAIWAVLRELGGGRPRLSGATLPFPPAAPEPYVAAFGLEPRWHAPGATLRFAASSLALPLPQADPHALALSESLCRDLVARRRARAGVADQVRVLITQRIEDGAPMAEVAAALALSERSLRRRLAAAGTTFRDLLDEVRRDLARELLEAGTLQVEDVAQRLGYAEASSFIVAHRRWTGRTPRSGRRTPSRS
jgi:AraC-like DNA-binding protein